MTTRKFYKKIITIEVLSEDAPFEYDSVESLGWAMTNGDLSGSITKEEDIELNGKEAVEALVGQGSDPEFFGLTDDGEDLE